MRTKNLKKEHLKKRHLRIRRKVKGTKDVPRLSVYRGLKNIYLQIIDDEAGKTLLGTATSAKDFKEKMGLNKNKKDMETAKLLGKYLGEAALAKEINKIVFDRGGYKYHGKVKAIADGAREAGVKF